ncbi:MAG TPA: hypothetical protein PKC60_02025 [Hydrogenophaga sp.]|uniref:hypothetical protein n=1 Tax=Hydrogenophaga sp. TaxID=1904254 RepID=UPI002BBB9BD0|nr:hypothetical protein [Hydrogenophaga sp.]HMN91984.1 hypothetical protein [Hydrogenophaga sp.]HMP08786.1 hypothetical protein [Hydrogenophaga sp.]
MGLFGVVAGDCLKFRVSFRGAARKETSLSGASIVLGPVFVRMAEHDIRHPDRVTLSLKIGVHSLVENTDNE